VQLEERDQRIEDVVLSRSLIELRGIEDLQERNGESRECWTRTRNTYLDRMCSAFDEKYGRFVEVGAERIDVHRGRHDHQLKPISVKKQ
jgi:hypothetical protein